MKKTTKGEKKKTTAAEEKAAREARESKKAPSKSKAAREALATAAALSGQAAEAATAEQVAKSPAMTREEELALAARLGVELADNESFTRPDSVPEGCRLKKVHRRGGVELAQPIFKVEGPDPAKPSAAAPSKRTSKKAERADSPRAGWDKLSVEGERAQAVLKKLQKGTRDKPVMAAKELNDNERHMARRLFAHGLISRDKFEQGIGYFAG
jgi:hypothetical protein